MKYGFIPVCEPFLNGRELEYVTEAVKSGWISSSGKYVKAFEEAFAKYCGAQYAVCVCNGTVALHLALVSAGIGKGDEVIIPDFTMIASAFAVCYSGAVPVFVDAEKDSWNIDPALIREKITSRTKAIMPVSIFGHPCEMDSIRATARSHGLLVIEDAAESHGAEYKNVKTGNLADLTAFSFFANKNLTTGEGGMVVTNDEAYARNLAYYKNLCFPVNAPRNYRHDHIGFNYRMSNLHAAIGLAQVEKADEYRDLRRRNNGLYRKFLADVEGISFQKDNPDVLTSCWMNAIVIDRKKYGRTRDEVMGRLKEKGIDTRLLFAGMHTQKALQDFGAECAAKYPITEWLTENGFYLPSGSTLDEPRIDYISSVIRDFRK